MSDLPRILLLRTWDSFVATAPLLSSLWLGQALWRKTGRAYAASPDLLASPLLAGAVVIQALTWAGALFSGPLTLVIQWLVVASGGIALILLFRPGAEPGALLRAPRGGAARLGAALGLGAGLALADSRVPDSVPSDAIAYHIPISAWFGRGGAWSELPNHIWTAQWPNASSLWSSFTMGHVPVADRLVAWSAQNYAFLVWTAVVVFDAVRRCGGRKNGRGIASCFALALAFGAYSGYQGLGFVDYRFGLFAAALVAVLLEMPPSRETWPICVGLASCTAEFRPQGLLFTLAIGLSWIGIHAVRGAEAPAGERAGPSRATASIWTIVAASVLAKWWVLTWVRWGTPAPPLFARWLNLRGTERYADEVFRYRWGSDIRGGLRLLFLGTRETVPLTVLAWASILLAVLFAWRSRSHLAGLARLGALLAPVGACAYAATQVPEQAARMMAPIVPALVILVAWLGTRAFDDPLGRRWTIGVALAFAVASVATAPFPWERPHAGRTYPTPATTYFSQVESQLKELREPRPLMFDQYVAFLPRGFRQMGETYGPWATLPNRPLVTLEAWMEWLRGNDVETLVVQRGKPLEGAWEWARGRADRPDFSVLDRWMRGCAGRRDEGQWIVCRTTPQEQATGTSE